MVYIKQILRTVRHLNKLQHSLTLALSTAQVRVFQCGCSGISGHNSLAHPDKIEISDICHIVTRLISFI